MIVFVVPFRTKLSSENWKYQSELINRTIESLLNQTDLNYRIIIVYTDYPDNKIDNSNLMWLYYPYPFLSVKDITDYENYAKQYFIKEKFAEFAMDQAKRIMYGCRQAKEIGAEYVMSVDADDLISNRISAFVNKNKNEKNPGWFVNKGFVYLDGENYIYRYPKNLNLFCASTYIIRTDIIPLPNFESKSLLDFNFFSSHAWLISRLKVYQNIILKPLPFRAIIYILNTASWMNAGKQFQASGIKKVIKILMFAELIKKRVKKEFALRKIKL